MNPQNEPETNTPDRDREGSITDEKLPHRFGNRKQRRKMQSEIKKLNIK